MEVFSKVPLRATVSGFSLIVGVPRNGLPWFTICEVLVDIEEVVVVGPVSFKVELGSIDVDEPLATVSPQFQKAGTVQKHFPFTQDVSRAFNIPTPFRIVWIYLTLGVELGIYLL